MSTTFIDFKLVKQQATIQQVVEWLGLKVNPKGQQLRGCCPIHNGTNDREFVVTPAKDLWFCFAGCGGGDQIKLVALMRNIEQNEAAHQIAEHFRGTVHSTATRNSSPTVRHISHQHPRPAEGLRPLDYLLPEHEAVQALGVSPATAAQWESGYASKGLMRGRYAVPVKAKDGTLIAYVGIAVANEQTPRFLLPNNVNPHDVIFGADRVKAGPLYLVRTPLDVLLASENGIENAVAFVSEITPQQLEQLAALCDERKCEAVELF